MSEDELDDLHAKIYGLDLAISKLKEIIISKDLEIKALHIDIRAYADKINELESVLLPEQFDYLQTKMKRLNTI